MRLAPFVALVPFALPAFAGEAINLAPGAAVSASSTYSADYRAQFAIDGEVPECEGRDDARRAWCLAGDTAKGRGEFTLAWPEPVEVAEVVYFGRTAQALEECWKDYEVYLDADPAPAAKGTFQMVHGPQRIALTPRSVQHVRLKFLNSHGRYNGGAPETPPGQQ